MRNVQRKFEAIVGGKLLQSVNRYLLKQSELVPKQVTTQNGLAVHYMERNGTGGVDGDNPNKDRPTLLLLHGITDEAKNLAAMVIGLKKEFPHWRMIVPDLIGHGKDLERLQQLRQEGNKFDYPTPEQLLQSVMDFLTALQIQKETSKSSSSPFYVFGISLGGALAYFLQEQQPQLVDKTVLINPAIEHVLDEQFINDFVERKKNHFCIESREDVKTFFRDLSSGPNRQKKDPIPKFLLEAIWQDRLQRVDTNPDPNNHFRKYFTRLLEERGKDPEWAGCSQDIAPNAKRLVLWPENDFIANHDKGKRFFETSNPTTTTFVSVPDCGHLFHSNGKTIIEHTLPQIIDYLKQEQEEETAPTR